MITLSFSQFGISLFIAFEAFIQVSCMHLDRWKVITEKFIVKYVLVLEAIELFFALRTL